MSFKSLLLLLCLAASVSALTTPRSPHHHRAIAHRAAAVSHIQPILRTRADGKRCKPRPASSSVVAVPTTKAAFVSTPEPAPTSTPHPDPSPSPKPATSSKEDPTPSPEPHTTSKADPSPSPKPTTTPKDDPTPTPKPTSTPEPQPTTTPKPQPTTTHQPAPTTTKASGGGGGGAPSFMTGIQSGQGTFYSTGLGACGIVNSDTDYIAAVSHLLFDAVPGYNGQDPNSNPICGRKVRVSFEGKSVVVAVTDRCEGCALTDLDFSPSAFNQLADFARGRIGPISWVWL
ncbi:putative lytic transglycolase [Lyophyllum shimeji]|uniref:Lytic transglycolase n=1 Tax=Lyophyllum shimeji TaxID=47721 RepID=A0A9P3PHJ7_LYOSH|nr:putative lytic transglycolase [Lyophyllum shimeji]